MRTPLAGRLAAQIAAAGPMPVDRFMAAALSDPEHGYYRRRDAIGAAGDFITAPEISQIFGELVGLWCAATWQQIGRPDPVALVELGPGRGSLMADLLRASAQAMPAFNAALRLHLVEINRRFRRAQRERIEAPHITWHDDAAGLPHGSLIVVANEFFDALPVRQFIRAGGAWCERMVGWRAGEELEFQRGVAVALPAPLADRIEPDPEPGTIIEFCPSAHDIVVELAHRLVAAGGAVVVFDYAVPAGAEGSLQAVRRHARAAVLEAPGETDLSSHVDFAMLKAAALGAGAQVHGPVTQRAFLRNLGIETRLARLLAGAATDQARALVSGYHRLIDIDQMGLLFKVFALTAPGAETPPGFGETP